LKFKAMQKNIGIEKKILKFLRSFEFGKTDFYKSKSYDILWISYSNHSRIRRILMFVYELWVKIILLQIFMKYKMLIKW